MRRLDSKLNIAFSLLSDASWTAGLIYIESLLHALRTRKDPHLILSLLLPNKELRLADDFISLVDHVLFYPWFKPFSIPWFFDRFCKKVFRQDIFVQKLFRQHQVRIVAFGYSPKSAKIPTLCWIPDFQHRHFPEMFSPEECRLRDRTFRALSEKAARIILLSDSVQKDFSLFAPEYQAKTRVVLPTSYIPSSAFAILPKSVSESYHLPEKFIYFPGQFWKHKNHTGALEAIHALKNEGLDVFLVCSGNIFDYRNQNHFNELLQMTSRFGIRNQIAFLGLIPREHVLALMRQSIAVLNPSFFEGFGFSADEARSLGKPLLLSDIAAHRDQNTPATLFLNAADPHDIAAKMKRAWQENAPGPNPEHEKNARLDYDRRFEDFGESFMSVVGEFIK